MFEKKLNSLQYDKSFNIQDDADYRNLIYWIENMKIRFYPPESRNALLPAEANWNDSLKKYLDEINYSDDCSNKKMVLEFLLNIALQYEMEDMRDTMQLSKNYFTDLINVNATSDMTRIDVNSKDFIDGLKEVASLLNVPFYQEEPLVTLRAIAILLKRLKKSTITGAQSVSQQTSESKKKKIIGQVDENILKQPFTKCSTYDPLLNRAANVLRLMYIQDMRDLQTQINNMIVQVQSMTANPKTDTTLGRVGS